MELNDGIILFEEKAEEKKRWAASLENESEERAEYLEEAHECEQLAGWLRELKELRAENDGLKNQLDDLCENLAWYINERNRLISEKEAKKCEK